MNLGPLASSSSMGAPLSCITVHSSSISRKTWMLAFCPRCSVRLPAMGRPYSDLLNRGELRPLTVESVENGFNSWLDWWVFARWLNMATLEDSGESCKCKYTRQNSEISLRLFTLKMKIEWLDNAFRDVCNDRINMYTINEITKERIYGQTTRSPPSTCTYLYTKETPEKCFTVKLRPRNTFLSLFATTAIHLIIITPARVAD